MFKPGGVLIISGPEGTTECDTDTCGHCNGIVIVPPGQRAADIGGLCKQCMRFVCEACYTRVGCTPFEKRLEEIEAKDHAVRSYGLPPR